MIEELDKIRNNKSLSRYYQRVCLAKLTQTTKHIMISNVYSRDSKLVSSQYKLAR
jgi:hypothetical protein